MSTPTVGNPPESASASASSGPTPEQIATAACVETQLAASLKRNGKKRKATDGDETASVGTYRWYGRNLVRTVGPFARIHTIVQYGVKLALRDSDDEAPAPNELEQQLQKGWNIIKDTIPGFAEQMIGLGGNTTLRKQVCAEIQVGVRGARGDDAGGLKPVIADYMVPPIAPGASTPVEPVTKFAARGPKADRGFFNPTAARLLCPVKYPATEATFADIRNGIKKVYGNEIPYFMYRDGMVVDPEDMDEGLLESHVMFATSRHIYQGPTAALQEPGFTRGKAGNAALNGISALTDCDVAYVACQVRFALSSQGQWTGQHDKFIYSEFYWAIIRALRGAEGQAIIDRFNYAVFGTTASAGNSSTVTPAGPSDFDTLEAQRAAKRARTATAAAATTAATAS
ncbi:hypothetical protein B0H13DRAFT_1865229 [Mycena leptocephala]|nr:hypothetical protein B0H13DRAFT_1865229 [Mycena leptocephala]